MYSNQTLPEPTKCHQCGSPQIYFTNNKAVYGSPKGTWPFIWYCPKCSALVACHEDTRIPMGTMVDHITRANRGRAHKAFDKIWRKHKISTRTSTYMSLCSAMGMTRAECHIGLFDSEQCEFVVEWSKAHIRRWKSAKKQKSVYKGGKKVARKSGKI